MKSITCPLCHETFAISEPQPKMTIKKAQALRLRGMGYSLRKIMTMMRYKSVRSVQVLLEDGD